MKDKCRTSLCQSKLKDIIAENRHFLDLDEYKCTSNCGVGEKDFFFCYEPVINFKY